MLRSSAWKLCRVGQKSLQRQLEACSVTTRAAVFVGADYPSTGRGFAANSHDVFGQHRDEKGNTISTPFDFTDANYDAVADILLRYPSNYKQSACIPLLDLAQQQNNGHLTLAAMRRVAMLLDMPEIRVYEVATFYTMFNRSPVGRYHVMVCGTTPCQIQGSDGIYEAISNHLGLHYGQTSPDGLFTLSEMECMGACVNAPMIAIADYSNGVEGYSYKYFEDLTPADAVEIVKRYKDGEKPEMGSRYRSKAEPAGAVMNGKWTPAQKTMPTLTEAPPGPFCRDLGEMPAPEQPKA
ncbi:hypothetical protein WJX74_006659 [Apatococcus lobatus]|uniref:Uncharacterized protein n=1 Tax=Apatococcus lobatus TaxID=904363 RepID=A0AAW1S785_9CHLO